MHKRIIIQAPFSMEGLVIKVGEGLKPDELAEAILAGIPPEHASPDLKVFDEAEDEPETREFGEGENLQRGRVVHVGRCARVDVKVRYAGRVVDRRFAPATRMGRVKRWAVRELGISQADANELVLQLAGSSIQPSRDHHVGNYVEAGTCTATFDLVRSYTVNGDPTLTLAEDHAKLMADLERAPFLMGQLGGRWRLRDVAWPYVFMDVVAKDWRWYTLRLQCDGYPSIPTGAFWDMATGEWLKANRWPRTGARFGAALRTDWNGGTTLYIPCDRGSINGHEAWNQLHPAWAWSPTVGIARYLEVVWTMLNGDDYVAPDA
jgi:hypothetical protein